MAGAQHSGREAALDGNVVVPSRKHGRECECGNHWRERIQFLDLLHGGDGFFNAIRLGQGTVLFNVQHHWVTESGENIYFDKAVATTLPLSQTRFAIVSYPAHIVGGTGRFAGATGDLTNIGEADLVAGTTFRYSGEVCFGDPD